MREETCCFSGHRDINVYNAMLLSLKMKKEIEELITKGFKNFICGGALGFDTIAALTVLKAKKKFGRSLRGGRAPRRGGHGRHQGAEPGRPAVRAQLFKGLRTGRRPKSRLPGSPKIRAGK